MPVNKTEKSPLGYYTLGIAALFLAGFLLLVIFGAQSFRDTVAGQNDNTRTRTILSYLATCVRSNDTVESISVRESPESPVLVVRDSSTGYALRIYLHDGQLLEDFARSDDELAPESAAVIGETGLFSVQELSGGVLAVDTDEGRVLLHLRSGEGAAP